MKFLTIPTDERIKLQAQPFDGKKQCWAPDAKESFVAAEITGTKGEEVTVKTSKGEVGVLKTSSSIKTKKFSLVTHIEKGRYSTNESTEIQLLR